METDPGLLLDLVAALAIALAGGWLSHRLGFTSLAGYVFAGLIISPFTPGFVGDLDRLRFIADIGVVLILFGIGVQSSLREVGRVGSRIGLGTIAQVATIIFLTVGISPLLGWGLREAAFVGAAAAISSSAVVVKMLSDRGDVRREYGRASVAWGIVQDFLTVVLVAALTALAVEGDLAQEVGISMAKAVVFVVAVLVIGLRIVPPVLERIADAGSRELFMLAIAGLALGTALISDQFGLSIALGAFLAGILVSESALSYRVLGDLLPVRDVFAVFFFVSIGMLIDPDAIRDNVPAFLAVLALMTVIKGGLTMLLARISRVPGPTSILTGAAVAQGGEFSFVLIALGLDREIVDVELFSIVVAAVGVSVILSPGVLQLAHRAVFEFEQRTTQVVPVGATTESRLGRKAVVCGVGGTGRLVVSVLAPRFEVTVVDEDPRALEGLAGENVRTIVGDAASPMVLDQMGLDEARVLVIAISDPFATRLVVERAQRMRPALNIIARALDEGEAAWLRGAGVSEAVVANREVGLEMLRHSLHRFGLDTRQIASIVQSRRMR